MTRLGNCLLLHAALMLVACNEYVVTKTADTNDGVCDASDCSLREAVAAANNSPGIDVITLETGHYRLTMDGPDDDLNESGDLDILEALIINAGDRDNTVIDGDFRDRVLHAHSGSLYVRGVTIQNGRTAKGGAGILVDRGASLQMEDVMVTANQEYGPDGPATSDSPASRGGGGGVYSAGDVTLNNVVFEQNHNVSSYIEQVQQFARGAGLAVAGPLTRNEDGEWVGESIDITLDNVRFYNNRAAGRGGGMFIGSYTNTRLSNLDMEHNGSYTDEGGGLYFADYRGGTSQLFMTDSRVYDNYAGWNGGGMSLRGAAQIHRSSIYDNEAVTNGGGVSAREGVLLRDLTVRDNRAKNGGGVYSNYEVTLENTTLSDNTATFGGGIHINLDAALVNSTIAHNHAFKNGGGLSATIIAGPSIVNTIIADNSKDLQRLPVRHVGAGIVFNVNNCSVHLLDGEEFPPISLGNNLANDETCGFTAAGDVIADPLLQPLADNGGPTMTHAIPVTSPAVDAGSNDDCTDSDQRGLARPVSSDGGPAICDIGAYEWSFLSPTAK